MPGNLTCQWLGRQCRLGHDTGVWHCQSCPASYVESSLQPQICSQLLMAMSVGQPAYKFQTQGKCVVSGITIRKCLLHYWKRSKAIVSEGKLHNKLLKRKMLLLPPHHLPIISLQCAKLVMRKCQKCNFATSPVGKCYVPVVSTSCAARVGSYYLFIAADTELSW